MNEKSESTDGNTTGNLRTTTGHEMEHEFTSPRSFSLVERVINKGPIPNAQSNPAACVLNMIFYSCILPIAGVIYIRLNEINILNFPTGVRTLPIEILILWIAVFLFLYTCLVYHASGKLRKFLTEIGPCLAYDKNQLAAFEENTIKRVFKPPQILLIPLLFTIPFGVNGVISNPIYTGNILTTALIGLILLYSTLLHWVASWMLYTFLATSSKFGRDVPLRINAFDPDKVGGLAPLSNLSTLAIFDVGLISLLVIPIWQIFYPPASFVMIGITSILIPAYFLFSMRGIYNRLREEKEASLNELNDEIQQVSQKIRNFIKTDHERKRFDEKEVVVLGQTLSSMDIIYGHVRSMHTFPVNAEIIAKVFVSAILPILAVVLDFVLSRFL